MNDSELETKLKAAREPDLPADYLGSFPQTVLKNLRSSPREGALGERVLRKRAIFRRPWLPRLAWVMATTACILIAFAIGHRRGLVEGHSEQDVLADAKLIRETLAMFPNQVRAIVQDEHGLKLVLADKPDVPDSTPIYVHFCDDNRCSSLVTFSGQEIQIGEQKLTVLSEPDGGIILEGNQFVWSTSKHNLTQNGLKIEAKTLNIAKL